MQDFLQGVTTEASPRVSAESANAHPGAFQIFFLRAYQSVPSGVSPRISVGVPSGIAPEVPLSQIFVGILKTLLEFLRYTH